MNGWGHGGSTEGEESQRTVSDGIIADSAQHDCPPSTTLSLPNAAPLKVTVFLLHPSLSPVTYRPSDHRDSCRSLPQITLLPQMLL